MPGEPRVGVAAIREALRRRVEETSIRAVADEVGMSRSGLHVLLKGSKPHSATTAKLVAWYVRRRENASPTERSDAISPEDAEAAVALLALYLKAQNRDDVRARQFRGIAARIAEQSGVAYEAP